MSTLVSTGGPENRPTGLAAAFLVALLLHGAALVGIAYYRLQPPAPPGENVISIDLAPQMSDADTVAPTESLDASEMTPETVPTETPTEADPAKPPETATQLAPEETVAETPPEAVQPPPAVALTQPPPDAAPVEPESQVITSTAPQAEPLAPPPPVTAVAPEPPKPVEAAKPKLDPAKLQAQREAKLKAAREEKRQEQIEEQRDKILKERREAKAKAAREARVRAAESQGSSTRSVAAASRQGDTGQAARGNDPNALARWKGMLFSAIKSRVNNNAAAGTSGGTVTVVFTVSLSGQVLSASLGKSSGIGAIDSAALAAVRGRLPAAPPGMTNPTLQVTAPMRFSPGG